MKKLLLFCLLGSVPAFGQAYSSTALQNSPGNYSRAVPYAQVTLCASTDTAVPCTQKAVTYVDDSLTTQCTQKAASGVLTGNPAWGTGCNNPGIADGYGNFTLFAQAGNYRICVYAQTWFCQEISIGGGGGGSPSVVCTIAVAGSIAYFSSSTVLTCDPTFITDGSGNWTAQSGRTLGPVNGMLGIVGGGTSPGTQAKYKLGAHEFRWLGASLVVPYYLCPPTTIGTVGQVLGLNTQTTDGNGDVVNCLQWQNGGGVTYPNAGTPATPVVTQGGTPGATTYSYETVCTQDGLAASNYHSAPSPVGTTTTGNATLSNTNYNLITGYADTLYGYRGCNVYRTAGGATQGLIATNVGKAFRDTGLAGNGATPPSTNTSILDPTGPSRGSNQCNSVFHSAEGVDALPCSPNLYNLEASNTYGVPGDVNDGVLQWGGGGTNPLVQGGATSSWSNGMLVLTSDTTSTLEALVDQNALPTAPYTFITYLDMQAFDGVATACTFGFRESSSGKIAALELEQGSGSGGTGSGGVQMQVIHGTSGAALSQIKYVSFRTPSVYISLEVAGGNMIYSYSVDGVAYQQFYSEALTTPFTTAPNQFFFGTRGQTSAAVCAFDYERRTQ